MQIKQCVYGDSFLQPLQLKRPLSFIFIRKTLFQRFLVSEKKSSKIYCLLCKFTRDNVKNCSWIQPKKRKNSTTLMYVYSYVHIKPNSWLYVQHIYYVPQVSYLIRFFYCLIIVFVVLLLLFTRSDCPSFARHNCTCTYVKGKYCV